ncbi:acyltransferase [Microbacterium lushaniae]|uniref:Acyltransferase n=2 Tax=Microbacterium lushaniae TaxID=2614639 RepID=A0A5J6L832_9MICO|nr:acyltransferase [Microbacterium lushaniae]
MVIATHVVGWPGGGFAGVDVFFVVSGFLITGLLLREVAETGRVSLREFFGRRIRRLMPAAVLVLLAVCVAAFFLFNRARADATWADAVAAALFVSNWRFAAEGTDYFSEAAVSPLQHFWSLSVEEQFSLVWPVLVVVAVLLAPRDGRRGRAGRAAVGAVALLVGAASWGWAVAQTAAEPTVAYFSTTTRAWELAVGALLAVAAPALARIPAAVGGLLQWAGLAGVVWSCLVIDPSSAFPAPWAVLPVAATALVVAGGVGGDPRHRHLFPLTNPVSVWLGDVSYALYLWHFPVLVFAGVLLPAGDGTTAIVLVATAVLAVSTYYGVEQPLHRSPLLLRRAARPALAAAPQTEDEPASVLEPASAPPRDPAPAPPREPASARHGVVTTRPAGWVPGQRYYPGRQPRPDRAPAAPPPAAQHAPPRGAQHAPQPAPVVVAAPVQAPLRRLPLRPAEPAGAPPSPWAQWRARYGAQMGMSAAALGIGAIVVVLMLQTAFGSPVIGPLVPPVADPVAAPAEDPTAALQAELAEAVSAEAWPDLRPSLDEVMAASSSVNPARDCFAPDVPVDSGRCTWGDADAARHMYLVGDSTAMSYAPAFKKLAEDSGGTWRITTVGLYGCRFTDVLVQNPDPAVMAACPQRKLYVRALMAAEPADLVVVSNAYTLGRTVEGRDLSAADLLAATHAEVSAYGAAGVVYLAPPPPGGDLARCFSPVTAPAQCLTAVDQTWRDMHAAAEATAAATQADAIGSLEFSCWQDACPAFAGDLPIRYDATHLTVPYAEHITGFLSWSMSARGLL